MKIQKVVESTVLLIPGVVESAEQDIYALPGELLVFEPFSDVQQEPDCFVAMAGIDKSSLEAIYSLAIKPYILHENVVILIQEIS